MTQRIFSGVQPTGGMHLGNYLGAFRNWVSLQADYACYYGIVDLHAITQPFEPAQMVAHRRESAKLLIAIGIDPDLSLLYFQSEVPEHVELAWVLGTMVSMGSLNRMTQYKEKSDKHGANFGLFAYPVLQAADILIHRVHGVPVGEDQKQHLELTRDIAERFNGRYGDIFPVPEPIIPEAGARVMSLLEPHAKMSKSEASDNSRINLLDPPEVIRKKFSRAVTDSETEVRYDPEHKAGVSNLLEMTSLLSQRPIADLEAELAGAGYAKLKEMTAEATVDALTPIQERYRDLSGAAVDEVLQESAARARTSAAETIAAVYGALGLAD